MYRQKSQPLKTTANCLLALVIATMMDCVLALSTDRDQDIMITADSAEMDDIKGVTIYRGDVVADQGSIHITGHTMTVYNDDDGEAELIIMQGTPATYRQLPDDSEIYDEAEALQMEYYPLKDYIILIDEAFVTQEGLRLRGNRIEYDTVLSQVKAEGTTAPDKPTDPAKKGADGRIQVIIKKKQQAQ